MTDKPPTVMVEVHGGVAEVTRIEGGPVRVVIVDFDEGTRVVEDITDQDYALVYAHDLPN